MHAITEPLTVPAAGDALAAARAAWRRRVARVGSLIQLAFAILWIVRGTLATGWPGRLPLALALAAGTAALAIWGTLATRGLAPRPRGPAARHLERAITTATAAQLAASCILPVIVTAACSTSPSPPWRSPSASCCCGCGPPWPPPATSPRASCSSPCPAPSRSSWPATR